MHPSSQTQKKVLIVDDEPANVRLLERILAMVGGITCCGTTKPCDALGLCLEFEPDLVLLDLHMPIMDGFAVLEQIKAATSPDDYLPVLVLTADITMETKRRALSSGAKDFVTKPLDHFEIVLRIKNLLQSRALHLAMQGRNERLEQEVGERTAQLEETLSQLRSAQEQVVKRERLSALGMMAGGIAHDFNNALTMMLGYGELLLPYVETHAPRREAEFLRHMVAAAQDATHVVSRLREFYRPDTGQELRVSVDLNTVVEQAISLTAPKWRAKCQADGVQIEVRSELGKILPIAGNAPELREVLTNLIFNAVDAMPDGGQIVVRTALSGEQVTVAVTDSGIGMTASERERCLEPFFTTKGDHGTGLGLSVVYGIIQRHGGGIEIESEKGHGTTFRLTLPVTTAQAVETCAVVGKLEQTLQILVVDDQEIICELIAEYLQADGHTVTTAANGREALEQFKIGAFDLVITDQSMPEMNGEQLAKAIAELAPETALILLTGFGEEMRATGNHPEVIDLVVSKPVTTADLRRAIQDVITRRAAPELQAA